MHRQLSRYLTFEATLPRCTHKKIQFDKPHYEKQDKLPFIPLESEIDSTLLAVSSSGSYDAYWASVWMSSTTTRPHQALKGKTAVKVAGITVQGKDRWLALIKNASFRTSWCGWPAWKFDVIFVFLNSIPKSMLLSRLALYVMMMGNCNYPKISIFLCIRS